MKFYVRCQSSDSKPHISSPWNSVYRYATAREFETAGYDSDYMVKPDALDAYDDLEYIGWALAKTPTLLNYLQDNYGLGAVCIVRTSDGEVIPVEISGDRVFDIETGILPEDI